MRRARRVEGRGIESKNSSMTVHPIEGVIHTESEVRLGSFSRIVRYIP